MKREYKLEEAEINLTPLIDVVFVVLIIFILIAPMLEIDRVELATSGAHQQEKSAPEAHHIAIHVKHDNTIWFQGRCVDKHQLIQLLKNNRRPGLSKIPQLFQDHRSSFGTYQTVKNAVEAAGYDQMDVILKPDGVREG